jgi:hypothetical protein
MGAAKMLPPFLYCGLGHAGHTDGRSAFSALGRGLAEMTSVFFSYSHVDESFRDQLETQLVMLRRQGAISVWHDRRIAAGQELHKAIDTHIETDDIVLLLVSSDFLASDYCYEREMARAIERHEQGDAIVIPVILRSCDWQGAPFGKLLATPLDGRPITQWPDRDQAFLEVVKAIKGALARLDMKPDRVRSLGSVETSVDSTSGSAKSRSSNLRLAKHFTQRDKDLFRADAFEFIAKYFENSLAELAERNQGIECDFARLDAVRFTAKIYRGGNVASLCTIFTGGMLGGDGIAYASSITIGSSSYNECLSVYVDDQSMYLTGFGMSYMQYGGDGKKLSLEGAAELFWSILIQPLQHRS